VARAVLRKLEATARDAGLLLLWLETNRALKEAQALYRKEGYVEVAPFNDERYAHRAKSICSRQVPPFRVAGPEHPAISFDIQFVCQRAASVWPVSHQSRIRRAALRSS
jgi:hypothetical protein